MRISTKSLLLSLVFAASGYTQENPVYEFPSDLQTVDVGFYSTYFRGKTDTLKGEYIIHPASDYIKVVWSYRPSTDYKFNSLNQKLSVSFKVLDVWAPDLEWMFIVGVDTRNGNTIVEKWKFIQHPIIQEENTLGGDTLWKMPAPDILRIRIYDSDKISHICDIFGDPQKRFILLLGWENKFVYQMDPDTGSVKSLFKPSDNPDILNHKMITMMIHKTEGYIYYLVPWITGQEVLKSEWLLQFEGRRFLVCDSVIFRDSDMDGQVDEGSLKSMTKQQWYDGGYLGAAQE